MALALAHLLLQGVRAVVGDDVHGARLVPAVFFLEHLSARHDLYLGPQFCVGVDVAGCQVASMLGPLRVYHPVVVGVHPLPGVAQFYTLLVLCYLLGLIDPLDLLTRAPVHRLDGLQLILFGFVLGAPTAPGIHTALLQGVVVGPVGRSRRPVGSIAHAHVTQDCVACPCKSAVINARDLATRLRVHVHLPIKFIAGVGVVY